MGGSHLFEIGTRHAGPGVSAIPRLIRSAPAVRRLHMARPGRGRKPPADGPPSVS